MKPAGAGERRLAGALRFGRAFAQAMETRDFAPAAISDERDLLGLALLEAHRRAGRNVQMGAECDGAVELERLVDLEEV